MYSLQESSSDPTPAAASVAADDSAKENELESSASSARLTQLAGRSFREDMRIFGI